MEINIFIRDNGKLILDSAMQFTSLTWEERYNDIGRMQVVFPKNAYTLAHVKTGRFALLTGSTRMMAIHSIKLTDNQLWAYGYEAKALLQKQIYSNMGVSVGEQDLTNAIENAVYDNVLYSYWLTYLFDLPEFGNGNIDALEYTNVYEFITAICDLKHAGWSGEYDERYQQLYVKAKIGVDRHDSVIFSTSLGNAWGISYTRNDQPIVSDIFVYGLDAITDPSDPQIITAHATRVMTGEETTQAMLDVRESYPRKADVTLADYEAALQTKAEMSLIARHSEETIKVTNIDASKFRTDFDLGDLVTVAIPDYGIDATMRIKGFTRTIENGNEKYSFDLSTVTIE